ncbi:GNAT family N-acetyltransferase [Candidatus Kuenenbacteria bacterium]|nr:GNAT family N-acetyltransferase [Candidatus Kuenenbacteria bacterium]
MTADRGELTPGIRSEKLKKLFISIIDPDDTEAITSYLRFEDDNRFERQDSTESRDLRVEKLKRKISAGDTVVILACDGDKIVASSSVTDLGPDSQEAWADGTLVQQNYRKEGMGRELSLMQEEAARKASKEAIVTAINFDNLGSIALRMRSGYVLGRAGLSWQNKGCYGLRKDLENKNPEQTDWATKVLAGEIKVPSVSDDAGKFNDQLLIDVGDFEGIKDILTKGYRGVYLLMPEDFPDEKDKPINKNYIVFVKA